MPPVLKTVLRGVALLLALVGAALALALFTFNPNDYKAQLIEQVQRRTQRTLNMPGDVTLRIFPRLGLELGPMSLSEPGRSDVFASVQQARVSLALGPLWRQRFEADRVQIDGLSLNLQRDAQGRGNWTVADASDAAEPAAPGQPQAREARVMASDLAIELAGLTLTQSRVRYTDAAHPQRSMDLQFDLDSGPIRAGKPTSLHLQARLQGEQAALSVSLNARAELTLDAALSALQWQDLTVEMSGQAGPWQGVQVALRAPQGELTPSRFFATGLALTAQGRQPDGRAWSARWDGEVQGDRQARRWQAQAQALAGTLTPAAGGDITVQGQGQAELDEDRESAHMTVRGQFDGSAFELSAGMSAWLQPAYTIDLSLDRLDVDHYRRAWEGAMPSGATGPADSAPAGAGVASANTAPPEGPGDNPDGPAWLALQASGHWQVQSLTVAGLQAQDVQLPWQLKAGQLDVAAFSASLYGGRVTGALSAQASDPPQLSTQQTWRGVALGPLLRDAGQTDRVDGVADGVLALRSAGATPQALTQGLQGHARVAVADGALKGVNLAALIRQAQEKIGQWKGNTGAENDSTQPQQTDFTALSASFQIRNGVARNSDLTAQTPLMRVGGQGQVDLVAKRLDYTVKATIVPTLQGQGGPALQALRGLTVPVKLSGPLDAVQWEVDRAALARELIKAPLNSTRIKADVQRQVDEEKASLQNRLKNQLKNLWGR